MKLTLLLTALMCADLFAMVWAASAFYPLPQIASFLPQDVQKRLKDHRPPFRGARTIGWLLLILTAVIYVGIIIWGGWDGVRRGFTFGQFFARFLIILYGVKAFDIIALDWFLITKTHFLQHYAPETEGCAGFRDFGYNRAQQLRRIVMLPFAALLTAWICTRF